MTFGMSDGIGHALESGATNRTEAIAIALRKQLLKVPLLGRLS